MATWKIITLKDSNIAVQTPYNLAIIEAAKRFNGRWIDLRSKTTGQVFKAWKVDAAHREAMEALCREQFEAQPEDLIERVITWTADDEHFIIDSGPTLDGHDLVTFGRDYVRVRHFERGEPVQVLEIINNNLSTGGSRPNPRLFGSVTLRVRCRAAAAAGGKNWTVEVE